MTDIMHIANTVRIENSSVSTSQTVEFDLLLVMEVLVIFSVITQL